MLHWPPRWSRDEAANLDADLSAAAAEREATKKLVLEAQTLTSEKDQTLVEIQGYVKRGTLTSRAGVVRTMGLGLMVVCAAWNLRQRAKCCSARWMSGCVDKRATGFA